jgi:hypothetical protein
MQGINHLLDAEMLADEFPSMIPKPLPKRAILGQLE